VRVSTAGLLGGFIDLLFFRATFFAPTSLGLALAERFLVVGFATVRFAIFARADIEALRVRPRPVDFPFRTVDRFFRLAMIAACSSVGLLNEIPRVYRAHYWLNVEESKLRVVHQTPCRRYRSWAGESNSEQLGSYWEGTKWLDLMVEVDERDYFVRPKKRLNGFYPTDLEFLLRNLDVDNVVLTGTYTDACVLSTAFDAANRDLRVLVPRDIVAGYSAEAENVALMIRGLTREAFTAATSAAKLSLKE
jgi:hypothetical protein